MDEQTFQQQSVYQKQPIYQQPNWMPMYNQEEPKQWLAITSFVLSLLGFNLLWLIFWIIALNKKQLRRAALAWTIISAVKLALSIIILAWVFFGALAPRMSVAQWLARDSARRSDLTHISTKIIEYIKLDWNDVSSSSNWCVSDLKINSISQIPEDPIKMPWLFCDRDSYWYWTDWNNFVLVSAAENWRSANLCNNYVNEFENALNQNNIDTAKEVLSNVWNSCNETWATNLYYVFLF